MARRLAVGRFEVHQVNLDPTVGREIRKARPCVIVSPNEMNRYLRTVIVAPMTTHGQSYPTRIPVRFRGIEGRVALDQIRTVDKVRLVRQLGRLDQPAAQRLLEVLAEMFAP